MYQLCSHPQLVEQLRDCPVKRGALTMPRDRNPLTAQILGGHRTDARERVTAANEQGPGLGAELERPQVGGGMTGWRHQRVQASLVQLAPQRSAIALKHGELNPGALAAESTDEL